MSELTFREYLYDRLVGDGHIEEDDLDEVSMVADDVLEIVDEVGVDELQTYANTYAKYCAENNIEPDYEGFEDYEA